MCVEKTGDELTGDDMPGVIKVLKGPIGPEDFNYLRHQIWPCGECVFFSKFETAAAVVVYGKRTFPGYCCRKSPEVTEDGLGCSWPMVYDILWCGESVPNEKAIAEGKAEIFKEVAARIGLKTVAEVKKEGADALKVFEGENQAAKEINAVHVDCK